MSTRKCFEKILYGVWILENIGIDILIEQNVLYTMYYLVFLPPMILERTRSKTILKSYFDE
jgi:hypothetical protein